MTTVAYKDGFMASDSKCTDDFGSFCTRIQKIHRLSSGALLGQAGDADIREMLALLDKTSPAKLPTRQQLADLHTDCSLILAFPAGRVFLVEAGPVLIGDSEYEWIGSVVEMQERMAAVGSGYQYALGAMKAGRSAAEAVAIACHFDSFSMPPVREVRVKKEAKAKARM
jgi:hypothetical protein